MALEDLLAALERDARDEAQSLLAAARSEAERIVSEAKEILQQRREAHLRAREAQLRREMEAALLSARRAARSRLLQAKWRVIEGVFDTVRSLLPTVFEHPGCRSVLRRDFVDALECLAGRPAEARVSPTLVSVISSVMCGTVGIVVRADPTIGAGFRIEATDGSFAVDGTLEKRLEQQRQRLVVAIVRFLEA